VMTQRSRHQHGDAGARVRQVRLFRRHPAVGWEYRVHEQLLPSLRRAGFDVRFIDITLEHTGYQDPALRRRKLERNLRLLHLDQADRPDDAFTLFNLGLAYGEVGRGAEAVDCLKKSLERCHPGDSIAGKLYAALVRAHGRLGQAAEAAAACRTGRVRCPDDPELLFLDGTLRRGAGDLVGAEGCWRQVVATDLQSVVSPADCKSAATANALLGMSLGQFTDLDEGLVAAAREELAGLCQAQGRFEEAEGHWKAAAERAGSLRALCGLGELYLAKGRWEELEGVARRLETPYQPEARAREQAATPSLALRVGVGQVEALVLRGRACLARKEYGEARGRLEAAIHMAPHAAGPRVFLTHVLLQEDKDLDAAEQALRGLVTLDPKQVESWRNLAVLLRRRNRLAEAAVVCQSGRGHCADDPELLLLHGTLLIEIGDLGNAEAALVQMLEIDFPRQAGSLPHESAAQQRCLTARHNLALIYRRQGRLGEAEGQWRAILVEKPDLLAAWLGLAELCLMQKRLDEAETILTRMEASANGAATFLRARLHMERKEFTDARRMLDDVLAHRPESVEARRLLSYAFLQEDRDLEAAELALCELVRLAPQDIEARQNLEILRRRQAVA